MFLGILGYAGQCLSPNPPTPIHACRPKPCRKSNPISNPNCTSDADPRSLALVAASLVYFLTLAYEELVILGGTLHRPFFGPLLPSLPRHNPNPNPISNSNPYRIPPSAARWPVRGSSYWAELCTGP